MSADPAPVLTRRAYLTLTIMASDPDSNMWTVSEAVATTAMAHPEWDMDETRTLDEWRAADR